MKKLVFILVITLALVSCHTQKNAVIKGKDIKFENLDEEKLFKNIVAPLNFTNLKIKASADIESGNSYPAINLTLYFEKNEQIWANASLLLPLARASIKPSGFKMYERINKTYIDSDFDYVKNLLKINFIDYQNIENLLLGKLFFPVNKGDYDFSINNNNYILTSSKPIKIGKDGEARSFAIQITYDSNFNLKEVILEDKNSQSLLKLNYGDYVNFENTILPKNIKIFIKDKKETKISLDYNKFESIKMDTPFEIPKGYVQRKIN